jgi:hypothetical protein
MNGELCLGIVHSSAIRADKLCSPNPFGSPHSDAGLSYVEIGTRWHRSSCPCCHVERS